MACPECGCDWSCCEGGCLGRWQFFWWRITHPIRFRAERERIRSEA